MKQYDDSLKAMLLTVLLCLECAKVVSQENVYIDVALADLNDVYEELSREGAGGQQ